MPIRSSEYFIYANRYSSDFQIYNINMSSGMMEEPWTSGIELKEIAIRGRDTPYFQEVVRNPLKFSVTFAFLDTWDEPTIRESIRWLTGHQDYQPLIFSDHLEKIYYALVVEEPTLIHNGFQQGYVKLTFRCSSPYAYSPVMETATFEWTEAPLTITENDFHEGIITGLALDNSGRLTLPAIHNRWHDLSSSMKWSELS